MINTTKMNVINSKKETLDYVINFGNNYESEKTKLTTPHTSMKSSRY